ncbi:MAG: DUF7017 domain-containing protein [Bacteroidales bacterium]
MRNFETLKLEADRLRKSKKIDEALIVYREMWEDHREECTKWDGYSYAFCLKQRGDFKGGLDVSREIYEANPDFENISRLYAWCIFFLEVSLPKIDDEEKYLEAANKITELTIQDDPQSPYTRTVIRVLEYLNKKDKLPVEIAQQWCEKLDANKLSSSPIFSKKGSEVEEHASDLERYYMVKTKLLYEQQEYDSCIAFCAEAIENIDQFHYGNEVWFNRAIAISYLKKGDTEKAKEVIDEIISTKRDWYVQKECADIYHKIGDNKSALNFALEAALAPGDADKKVGLFAIMARILEELEFADEAKIHLELVYSIRATRRWGVNDDLADWLRKYNINERPNDKNYMLRKARGCWDQLKYADQEELSGRIKTILPNGISGFISVDQETSYFFIFRNARIRPDMIVPGLPVVFYLEDSYDHKRERNTKVAVSVREDRGSF